MVFWELWTPSTSSCSEKLITCSTGCFALVRWGGLVWSTSSPALLQEAGQSWALALCKIKESIMHTGRDLFFHFSQRSRSKAIFSFCSAWCCLTLILSFCSAQLLRCATKGHLHLTQKLLKIDQNVQHCPHSWLFHLTAAQPVLWCSLLRHVCDKPLLMQLGYRYNFMEKKQPFFSHL